MFYRHYDGGIYYTLGITIFLDVIEPFIDNDLISATHTEEKMSISVLMSDGRFYVTLPEFAGHVLYIGQDGNYWLRPRKMFHGSLDDGTSRFSLIC